MSNKNQENVFAWVEETLSNEERKQSWFMENEFDVLPPQVDAKSVCLVKEKYVQQLKGKDASVKLLYIPVLVVVEKERKYDTEYNRELRDMYERLLQSGSGMEG